MLEGERRFTADDAHELRTPLAALRVHAQLALASQPPPATREALEKVLAGVARATRLVEQFRRLARLDSVVRLDAAQPVDLAALAPAAVEEARGVAGRVPGDADLLGASLELANRASGGFVARIAWPAACG